MLRLLSFAIFGVIFLAALLLTYFILIIDKIEVYGCERFTEEEILALCRTQGIPLAVTALSPRARDIRQEAICQYAVVIGSEGQGVSKLFLEQGDAEWIIPMNPRCESLNAAVAAAIVMWQMQTGRPGWRE